MPPLFGPMSPSPTRLWAFADALVVLRRRERDCDVPVDQREQAGFLAVEELLDDERPVARGVDCRLSLVAAGCHGHALTGRKSIGFDHHRDGEPAESGPCI